MSASGIDTCSIAFRPTSQDWTDLLLTQPHRPASGGGVVFLEPGPGGTKLGAQGRDVIWWEGRLDALLTDSESGWNLRPVRDVVAGRNMAAAAFDLLAGEPISDYQPQPHGEVRRFDLAHEFEFEDGSEGLAFLRTVAGMCPPRRKLDVWKGPDGQPQTVYVRQTSSRVVTERLYDKGVESRSHRPGERLRYEAQRRFPKASRYAPETLATLDLSAEYGRSMKTYLQGGEDVIAAGPDATVEHVAQATAQRRDLPGQGRAHDRHCGAPEGIRPLDLPLRAPATPTDRRRAPRRRDASSGLPRSGGISTTVDMTGNWTDCG